MIIIVILIDSKTEEVIYRCLLRLLYSHNPIVEIFLPLAGVKPLNVPLVGYKVQQRSIFFGVIRTTKYQSGLVRYGEAYMSTGIHSVFLVNPSTTGPP